MKKSIYFFILLLCVGFIFPAAENKNTNAPLSQEVTVEKSNALYEEESQEVKIEKRRVRLYIPESDSIKTLDIDEYVTGVLIAEMYQNSPLEALKAVAVAVRSYTLYMCEKNKNKEYDVVADPLVCQAYALEEGIRFETMKKAVEATKDEVATFKGEVILALYHASSGEYTENSENVFIESLSYLKGVKNFEETPYESVREFDIDEFNSILRKNTLPEFDFNTLEAEVKLNANSRCKTLLIKDSQKAVFIDGKNVRSIFSLKSTSFDIELKEGKVIFTVYGYGHGVGLSQNGAIELARMGKDYQEILKKYYSGIDISKTIYKS